MSSIKQVNEWIISGKEKERARICGIIKKRIEKLENKRWTEGRVACLFELLKEIESKK